MAMDFASFAGEFCMITASSVSLSGLSAVKPAGRGLLKLAGCSKVKFAGRNSLKTTGLSPVKP